MAHYITMYNIRLNKVHIFHEYVLPTYNSSAIDDHIKWCMYSSYITLKLKKYNCNEANKQYCQVP